MRKATGIIIGIVLGAVATALGVGIFLHKSNSDRERLAEQLATTAQEARTAREENQNAIENANKKLLEANTEVTKAQAYIKALEEEQALLVNAVPLTTQAKNTKGWKDVISLSLGVSLKIPLGNAVESNDEQALTIIRENTQPDADPRWLSIMPYNERLEQELIASLSTSTAISYLVNGRLMTGYQGLLPTHKEPVLILRIRRAGETTHLVWVRSINIVPLEQLSHMLATFRFAS